MLTRNTFQLEETVRLYEPCNVLLCLICRAGIKPGKGVASHFRNRHKLTGKELQAVLSFASTIPHVSDPATVELPHDHSAPIQHLPQLKGYSCTSCRHLTVNEKNAITHQTAERHERAGGRGWTVVTLQSFGRRSQARYWVVASRSADDSGSTEEVQLDRLAAAVKACEEALAKEAHERRMKVEEPGGPDVMSRWVEYMKWTIHLQKRDRAAIRAAGLGPMTAAAERNERSREKVAENTRLRVLAGSFERELRRCAQRIDRVPTQSLKWLASVDPTKPVGEPFRMKDRDKTWEFYCGRYQQYLCYCARMAELGRSRARREHGVQFNNEQWRALRAMVRQLDRAQDGGEEALAALDGAVLAFCICSVKQRLSKWAYVSPLLHFTSVLAIDVTGQRWMPAHSFTRHLAGFLWCSRVLMLEHLFAAYDRHGSDGGADGSADGSDPDPADSSSSEFRYSCTDTEDDVAAEAIDNFQEGRRAWLADGSYAVISTIIEWMSYGHGHRMREYGLPRLAWEEDKKTVNFEGSRIRVADFQGAAQHAARETELLLDGLMDGRWAQVRDTIALRDVADSLIYEGPGRSFATNRKNLWLQPGAGKLTQLVGPQLWRAVATGGGQVAYECRRQAAEEFLLRLKRFRAALFTSLHIWAGQPGRGPEMATLKHCDTEELPRNVFVFDGQVVLITDRDKQKRGRKVARWLPQDLSKAVVAFVAWLLPFEKVLYRLSGIKGLSETLEPWLFKDRTKGLWQTDDLSRQLDLLTSAQVGVRLTVASYRHVAIEFGRQVKGMVIRQSEMDGVEVDEYDEWIDPQTGETRRQPQVDYIWDLQSTHGSRVARHHYALSLQYPDQLQPEMLLNYQEISRLWHEFLGRSDGEFGQKRGGAGDSVSAPERKRVCTARQAVGCRDKVCLLWRVRCVYAHALAGSDDRAAGGARHRRRAAEALRAGCAVEVGAAARGDGEDHGAAGQRGAQRSAHTGASDRRGQERVLSAAVAGGGRGLACRADKHRGRAVRRTDEGLGRPGAQDGDRLHVVAAGRARQPRRAPARRAGRDRERGRGRLRGVRVVCRQHPGAGSAAAHLLRRVSHDHHRRELPGAAGQAQGAAPVRVSDGDADSDAAGEDGAVVPRADAVQRCGRAAGERCQAEHLLSC